MAVDSRPERFGDLLGILQALYDSDENKISVYTLQNLVCATSAKRHYGDIVVVEIPELNDTGVYSRSMKEDFNQLADAGIVKKTKVKENLGKGERELDGYEITTAGLGKGMKLLLSLQKGSCDGC